MKIIFFGTSEFAVAPLKALVKAKYDIAAVVTQPDRPAGRKQEPLPSPVKLAALKLGLKIFQPEILEIVSLREIFTKNWKLKIPEADLYIAVSYGQIIPNDILNLPPFGILNLHPSLLPKYRGASPIHAAILSGDAETGVSIIKLDEKLDHGPIITTRNLKMSKLYYKDLHDKLAELGSELLIHTLPDYISGKIKPSPQDDSKATFTKRITKDDGRINWHKSAEEIDRMIRAYHLWPVAWTTMDGKRLKIFESAVLPFSPGEGRSWKRGRIVVEGHKLQIATGAGALEILLLQLEGSRPLPTRDFVNGNPSLSGKILL